MFAIKIDDPKTEYLKVEVNLQDLDKEHLKDGTLLQTGRGRMGVFHDDALYSTLSKLPALWMSLRVV